MIIEDNIMTLNGTIVEVGGAVEHTELTDIDRAVAGFFQGLIHSLVVSDEKRKENVEFARFVKRDKKNKLYAGDFSDPVSFLQKLTAKIGTKIDSERNELLPAYYISREPTVLFCDGSDYIDVPNYGELTTVTGEPFAIINKSFVKLTYSVTAVAWSKATLSRMALGIMLWLRHTKRGRQHVFDAKSQIAGTDCTLRVEIQGLKDAMAEPQEVDHENTRLYSASLTFEVISEVLEAESISCRSSRFDIESGVMP